MTTKANAVRDSYSITVRVPLEIRKRGGRKLIIAPDGSESFAGPRPRMDNSLIKAIARAFRWRKLIEAGTYGSVSDIAQSEGINRSYVSRVLRLALLSPEIVGAILNGRQPPKLSLDSLMQPLPASWCQQRQTLGQ
jgi:hypothetical protein